MTDDKLLNQEEIDLLMKAQLEQESASEKTEEKAAVSESREDVLAPEEKDALGEIGNITMGSASTTLSELLNQKVNITSPRVSITNKKELLGSFNAPYLTIKVDFVEGLEGFNLLVMQVRDALVIADLMMGGDGSPQGEELTDMEISAAAEAMNMMIGSAATSLSQMFDKSVNISPPVTAVLEESNNADSAFLGEIEDDRDLVVVSFNMKIGDLVDTDIMQIMGIETAKEEAAMLWGNVNSMAGESQPPAEEPAGDLDQQEIDSLIGSIPEDKPEPAAPQPRAAQAAPQPSAGSAAVGQTSAGVQSPPRNLDLIMDIPLKVQVILGRTRKPIKEVLNIGPGTVLELQSLADEPVEILVNGTLVAEGEVVVVNENFGVKITNIISPTERIQRLAK
ncbi:MAG: flagellar motor switch phosphatase FliY [Desulfotomaculum sp.]|nr:flagellar motor switch phosphatase FliY [Desulfotomaculum sp.]